MVVWCTQNVRRDGSSFTWHQPCNNQNSALSRLHHSGEYSKTERPVESSRSGSQRMGALISAFTIPTARETVRKKLHESTTKSWISDHPVLELRSCVEVEVAVLGSTSLISFTVSVDVKQRVRRKKCQARTFSLTEPTGQRQICLSPSVPVQVCLPEVCQWIQ